MKAFLPFSALPPGGVPARTVVEVVCRGRAGAELGARAKLSKAAAKREPPRDFIVVPFLCSYVGCVTVSSNAGWPFSTTASARLVTGPPSLGFSIGHSAYHPMDCASLAKSIGGLSIFVGIAAALMSRCSLPAHLWISINSVLYERLLCMIVSMGTW